MQLSRRAMLAGAASTLASVALADAPATSMRPRARAQPADYIARRVADAGITGQVGVAVVDLETGVALESIEAQTAQPPASVTKAFTALYALETLGRQFRFETGIYANGPINNGILYGDLILAGGGDPNLATDDLAALAASVKQTGLFEVRGEFLVWDEALRNVEEIDAGQLDYLGYNPTITGLNLNFNRVHFEWKREDDDFAIAMDARSTNYKPTVTVSRMTLVDRQSPVFTYRNLGDVDQWTVARQSLNDEGSRWLPVRHPARYAGEVFATFARSHGIVLKAPKETTIGPAGRPLATLRSAELNEMMQGMLRYSTNLTAEASGMMATTRRVGATRGMRASAQEMGRWLAERFDGIAPAFIDHSGLGDRSRVSPLDTVKMLASPNVRDILEPIMREIRLVGDDDQVIEIGNIGVRAKTGTLNFVSTLAGYVRTDKGRNLAFAIFASDLDKREAGKREGAERPRGARSWNRRARALQQDILRHLALRLPG